MSDSDPARGGERRLATVAFWPFAFGSMALALGMLAGGRSLADAAAPASDRPVMLSASDLKKSLVAQSRELDLEAELGSTKALAEAGTKQAEKLSKARQDKEQAPSLSTPLESLVIRRTDLRGLPLLLGKACQTSKDQASLVDKVRIAFAGTNGKIAKSENPRHDATEALKYHLAVTFKGASLMRPLEQAYQAQPEVIRAAVVTALAEVGGAEVTQALARRAVFDVSAEVREAAIDELKNRPVEDARPVLLSALRHPWQPAADHAALALVELNDRDAAAELKKLQDLPDPSAPFRTKEGKWASRELVRFNHLRNCLLCHPVSTDPKDPLRTVVPTPGEPLPVVYYEDEKDKKRLRVRADVVYLRPDFSVMLRVEKPDKWPEVQRFDYLVRTRELSGTELEAAKHQTKKTPPQRGAVRWALTKLAPDEAVKRAR